MTDPAAPHQARLEAREREALRQRAEDADGWQRRAETAEAALAALAARSGAAPRDSYAHMCRDEHEQIGHNDSEHERCPLCRARDELAALAAARLALQQPQPPEGWSGTARIVWNELLDMGVTARDADALVSIVAGHLQRADAEATVTALRQDLQALVKEWQLQAREFADMDSPLANVARSHCESKARDLADRLAREEEP